MDTEKPLLKDSDGDDVDVHLYRSMIGSLMYLTSSRPDIMFVVLVDIRVAEALGHSLLMLRIVLGLEYEHCGYELICWNSKFCYSSDHRGQKFECLWLHTLHAKPLGEMNSNSFLGQCLSESIPVGNTYVL
ncbi:hypothetical protein Tco_1079944 [Tanacetum coccineum]|uniref:Reverse transcriptase Ty1/copia-type domain-containing protein n=1 Tax=Tanacetum coccineum TaxID=301880 RepID=A0ABQ5HU73_9ASTR